MELKFQNTRQDYIGFYKTYFFNRIKHRLNIIVGSILFFGFVSAGSPFDTVRFFIGIIIAAGLIMLFSYGIPLLNHIVKFNKAVAENKDVFDEKTLVIDDAGIEITSTLKKTFWRWESITSIKANKNFVYIFLADKKLFLLPKHNFLSDSDALNFVAFIQAKIVRAWGFSGNVGEIKQKPSYAWGLLCFIPMIGAIVGAVFLLNGLFKYKDKWQVVIGIGGIGFTIFLYSSLNYSSKLFPGESKAIAQSTRSVINGLIPNIEFYKLQHNAYPDSLEQLRSQSSTVFIDDPILIWSHKKNTRFNYKKVGEQYELFSSGPDGIPYTADDIYPEIAPADTVKLGWIKHKR